MVTVFRGGWKVQADGIDLPVVCKRSPLRFSMVSPYKGRENISINWDHMLSLSDASLDSTYFFS